LLSGHFSSTITTFHIVDCRYRYEYDGGHIIGAKNIFAIDDMEELFVKAVKDGGPDVKPLMSRDVFVFHCEFSSHRGPRMAANLRSRDRELNYKHYPNLHWPEIYVLSGGYREFF
ncbi:Rhodanese-like protein, partial [Gonapodya prolifera JEL478]